MLLLPILIACPAEQLGVELPRGGASAISQEDLQRDVYALLHEDPGVAFARRMEQMHVDAVERDERKVCARREGAGPPRVLVAPWPVDVDSAVTGAALVSVAKGWDGAGPRRDTWMCIAREGAGLPAGERVDMAPMTRAEEFEAVDYRALAREVAALHTRLDAQ